MLRVEKKKKISCFCSSSSKFGFRSLWLVYRHLDIRSTLITNILDHLYDIKLTKCRVDDDTLQLFLRVRISLRTICFGLLTAMSMKNTWKGNVPQNDEIYKFSPSILVKMLKK